MFTGIIQAIGNISRIVSKSSDSRIIFNVEKNILNDMKIGDSISVNGVCLSVVEKTESTLSVDISNETITDLNLSPNPFNVVFNGCAVGYHETGGGPNASMCTVDGGEYVLSGCEPNIL